MGAPPSPRPGWRYAVEGGRDLRLDLLRGFAVFAMVVDHIGGASWLYAITGGNRFFVSAAEGFVFLSGVVAGIVYGGRVRAAGLRATVPQLLQRSWTLYALAVWLAIASALVAAIFGLPVAADFLQAPPWFILEVITLQRTFYLVDVMLLYALVLLLTPLAFVLLRRRLWWLLALASWGLWGAYQFFPRELQLPWPIVDNPVFKFAPWQVLFFTGLILGYGRDTLARVAGSRWLRSPLRDGWVLPLAVPLGALIWLHITNGAALAPWVPGGDAAATLDRWFDKSALPPARLASCLVVFAFAWALVTRLWRPIRAAVGPFLLTLGQGALYAYAAHLFLIVAVQVAAMRVWGAGEGGRYPALHPSVNAAIQATALLVLWALTRVRFLSSVATPLGGAAVRRWQRPGRRALPYPGDSLAVILLVAIVAGSLAVPGAGLSATDAGGRGGAAPADPARRARPTATVTAPRRIGGPAKGSALPVAGTPVVAIGEPGAVAGGGASKPESARMQTATPPRAGAGGALADGEFYSRALGRLMPYGIYLPPGYHGDLQHYPVLYMLHGGGGHYSEWVNYGLAEVAEGLIAAGRIQPLVIVMPQGDQGYWVNHAGLDDERWGDYITSDLVAHIDATYRTIPQAGSRAIGGLSMGGFGALQFAFNHPNIFGAAGAHSPALWPADDMWELFSDPDDYARVDPLQLATSVDPARVPRLWLDVGEDDEWARQVIVLHNRLRARGIWHEYYLTAGDHNAEYWGTHLADYLRFYSAALLLR